MSLKMFLTVESGCTSIGSRMTERRTTKYISLSACWHYSTAERSNSTPNGSRTDAVINSRQLSCAWERNVRTAHASTTASARHRGVPSARRSTSGFKCAKLQDLRAVVR